MGRISAKVVSVTVHKKQEITRKYRYTGIHCQLNVVPKLRHTGVF